MGGACKEMYENGRARSRETRLRARFFLCPLLPTPATQVTYSALLLPLVLDSCCEGSHSKIDNIALQDKNPIRTYTFPQLIGKKEEQADPVILLSNLILL